MQTYADRLAQMERDIERIQRLRARWRHLFLASCVLSAASGVVIVSGRPPLVAIMLTLGSLAILAYARRFPRRAMEILRKYEDMTMP